ncbi:MAG: hypothetical protein F6J93_39955 [Oscillatoria sp. SIO1A7]|nr:hypothetical protein [Oscillatoria sp. SIO1A7]
MRKEIARRRIDSFARSFSEAHLYLAYHAAFPLALTPDLLYRLWANFQRDISGQFLNIPWVAVVDILLSPLCEEVGQELYEMQGATRNMLLARLEEDARFGRERIKELSEFLIAYVGQQLHSSDPDDRDFAEAQYWTALAYVRPSDAARELALALKKAYTQDRMELLRIASVVETFAEPLAEFEPLLVYARGMEKFARGDLEGAGSQLEEILEPGSSLQFAGVSLDIDESVLEVIFAKETPKAPFVPGITALLLEANPNLTAKQLQKIFDNNVNNSVFQNSDRAFLEYIGINTLQTYGEGIKQARRALNQKSLTHDNLAEKFQIDREQVKDFFIGTPVDINVFLFICQIINLSWHNIVSKPQILKHIYDSVDFMRDTVAQQESITNRVDELSEQGRQRQNTETTPGTADWHIEKPSLNQRISQERNVSLQELVLQAKQHPILSARRQQALTQLVGSILDSGRLELPHQSLFSARVYPDVYEEALQEVWLEMLTRIDTYEPENSDVIRWVNLLLNMQLFHQAEKYSQDPHLSLDRLIDNIENGNLSKNEVLYLNTIAQIEDIENPSLISDAVQRLIEEDSEGLFQERRMRHRPDANFRAIYLRRIKGESWADISASLNVPIPTLSVFYQRSIRSFASRIKTYLQG